MIKVKLVNLFRRAGMGFAMKTPQRELICDMQINASTALHEAVVPLETFLKHSKAIAQQAQQLGCGVYVADITFDIPAAVQEFWAGYNLAMDGQIVSDDASKAACAGSIVGLEHGHEIKEPTLPISEPKQVLVDALKAAEIEDAKTIVDGLSDETVESIVDNFADAASDSTATEFLPADAQLDEMGYRDMRELAKPFNAYKLGMTADELRAALKGLRAPAA